MPLIDKLNDTKLKSLKWGNDRPHGGSSNQPYIKVDINKLDQVGNQIRFAQFDDGLIRGGALGTTQASLTDLIRVGKFLTDFPKGPLFIAKQVGLQLSNPRIEANVISPLGNIGGSGAVVNTLNSGIGLLNQGINILNKNSIGPTRIYNLGINTLAQVPINAFGGHIVRHGFTPIYDEKTDYAYVVSHKSAQENRLVKLGTRFFPENIQIIQASRLSTGNTARVISTVPSSILSTVTPVSPALSNVLNIPANNIIDSYIGGPNSVYGIGSTTIRRTTNTADLGNYINSLAEAKNRISNIQIRNFNKVAVLQRMFTLGEKVDLQTKLSDPIDLSPTAKKYELLKKKIQLQQTKQHNSIEGKVVEHGPIVNVIGTKVSGWSGKHVGINMEDRIGLPGGKKDLINLTPLFEAQNISEVSYVKNHKVQKRDLVKFRIEAVNSDHPERSIFMIFRAYLKNITDNPSPSWSDVKYIGRGEKFYIYDSWSRSISFNFKVAALSAKEMEIMYQKMNFLFSNTAPDYSEQNLPRGPLMKLTIGNYLYRELGFISSLQYTISDETPWEIAINEPEGGPMMYELPMIMDINMTFTLIHNFLPQKSWNQSPFIINKPLEETQTSRLAVGVDNPWLHEKFLSGRYDAKTLLKVPGHLGPDETAPKKVGNAAGKTAKTTINRPLSDTIHNITPGGG